MTSGSRAGSVAGGYRHEAFMYDGGDEFMRGTLSFVRSAVAEQAPILVVLDPPKLEALREELGADADHVRFADMHTVGANPARIIPAWQSFLSEHARDGRHVRGLGEPISPGRAGDELAELQRHEALLNSAFGGLDFWLLCPYDTRVLDASVIAEAHRTHRFVQHDGESTESASYAGTAALVRPFDRPLPEPAHEPTELAFDVVNLRAVRQLTASYALLAGLDAARSADLVVAVSEIITNSVQHGGGGGTVRIWLDRGVICEVHDTGRLTDPMIGRRRPSVAAERGRGLWLANQLCDLVQLRSFPTETVVRLHMRAA